MVLTMKLSRIAVVALAAGVAGTALAVPFVTDAGAWTPVSRGLDTAPAAMLPATVDTARPVTVVSTTVDSAGRPVVRSVRATDRRTAQRLIVDGQKATDAVSVELDVPVYALDAPTGGDPYRNNQWDLAKSRVPTAWTTSTGTGTVVAVLDTGVDAAHPDLAGQVLPGRDLVAGTSGTSTDPNGHGTHVAGTIAALTGNELGVSGFAPDTRILPVRVLGADGGGSMSAVATGITWAADQGADVINMSLGSTGRLTAVTNAIAYARSKGVVVVAAAGNSRAAGSPVNYPAADAGVIAVAATDSADRIASYSNRGSYVDVAAPGSAILSTVPNGGYGGMSGTSMASPHVAALAAMIRAVRPGLTPDQVEKAITGSAVDLGTKGKDTDFGYGRIDAPAALALPVTTPVTKAPTPTPTPTPAPVVVTIGADAQPGAVAYGSPVKVTFTLSADNAPYARKSAQLCTADNNATAFRCQTVTTSATGTFTATRNATGPFRMKLAIPASKTTVAAESGTYAWTVRSTAVLTRGGATMLTARLGVPAGSTVLLERADGDTWVTVKSLRGNSGSLYVSGVARGVTYRVSVPDSPLAAGVVSNTVVM